MTELCQLIVDARRDGGSHGAVDEAVALEVAQCQRQHPLRHARDLAPQLVETLRPGPQGLDDEHGPLVADARKQGADGPANRAGRISHRSVTSMFLFHKLVRGSQKSAFLRAIRWWLFRVPR